MLEDFVLEDFVALDKSMLIDKLSEYTAKYTYLLVHDGVQNDVSNCKLIITKLQKEIERRQNFNDPTTRTIVRSN